ncbi:autotransporter domain-containing protein [Desulfovibrio piger]|uniref:autotransporter domain-containing protein n=1 Tax=Desulfovibrio piger TaxID=901 RepID=UPI0025A35C87|nr:autotransporter domain-containing protein [Desulfovibrio piger]MDM8330173.1 autotransporter domain-containing protein [Desulfovibrio piger]
MQLTKGAIGNLINRYKAVLKKCHLMNTFGSLAVAGMLVMGGAAAAGAAQWQDMPDNPTITIDQPNQQNNYADVEKGQTVVVNGANTATGAETSMAITGQEDKPGVNRGEIWVVSGEGGTGNGYAEGMGGVYNSQFSIVNEGSIFVDGDSASKAKAMSVNPNGSAENKGLIVIKNGGGIVDNSGSASKTMINSGTIAVEGEGGVGIFYRKEAITDGEVANRGTITVSNGGIGVQISNDTFNSSYNNKVFINSGTIIADADSVAIHTHYTDNATIRLEGASHVDGLIKLKGTNNKLVIDGVGANGQESLHVEGTLSGSISNGSNIAFTEDSQLGIDGAYSIDNTSTATLNNVTFIAGDNDASKALVVIDSDSVTLNGGLNTGAEADNTIDSMATTNGNATINGAVFKNNTFTAGRNYPIIGAVAANLGDQQSLTITGSTFEGNTVKLTGTGSSGSAGGAAVSVVGKGEGSTLTIAGSTFTGNHYQDTSSAANGAYGGAIGVQNASVILSKVEMSGNSADSGNQVQGGAYYQSKGSLTADTLKVSSNTVDTTSHVMGAGMALWGVGGSINNAEFSSNTATTAQSALGGGLYMRGSRWGGESDLQFSISNTSFTGNELASTADGAYGGGLYVKGDASNGTADGNGKISLELTGVTFDGNKVNGATESQGGALYILGADDPANATVTVSNSFFSNNKAEGTNGWGGAIYNAGTLSVDSTRFENNTASAQGGAIYVYPKAELDVTSSYFKGNKGTAGGAIAMFGDNGATPEHSISNTVFEGNTATREGAKAGKGGAIAILEMDTPNPEYTTALDLSNVTFLNNTSNGTGGAIHSESGTLTITDATFSGNSAEQQGGAIYNDANSSITFKGTNTFSGNTAAEGKDIYNAGSLTMSSGSDLVVYGSGSILNAAGGNINVENGARLTIADAVSGGTYEVVSSGGSISFNGGDYNAADSTGWKGENLQASSDMFILTSTDGMTFTAQGQDAHDVFTGLDDGLADAVNNLYARHGDPRNGWNYADVDAEERGIRFLSRATDKRFIGADHQAAAATIESAARIAFAGAVPQMTKMASDAGTNAVVNRLGFADPVDGAQAMDAEGKIVDRNTTGFALWIAPLWQNQHGWGMEAGNLDYGFNGNLGGVSLGADYTFENAIRAGITFNIGGGYAESSGGDLNSTENRMTFWGLGAYAGWNYENFGLMADVSYTSTWNDLEQDMDGRMGMGDLEADVQASAISAGLRAEYKLETSVLDIIPHIGVRYMSLNTWGYDVDTNGGTVLEGDGFHQDIWTFPIGVTFTKDFTLDSGWFFKPSVDFSVIPAAGDIKAKQDVAFTGLPGTYEVETQMMDYLTWQGGVGIQMGNDNLSFGVNYTLQAGQNTTGHGVFGSFRYEF